MPKGETISYKTGTEKYYRCLYKFEERCKPGEVILTSLILGAAFSPRLWIPEVKKTLTGQARRNYEKWPEWLSKNFRIVLWQIPNYIKVVKEEMDECWIKSKHDRDKVVKMFENRVRSIVSFLESIREEKSKAIIIPSVLQLRILRSSCYTRTQSAHVFYKSFLEQKSFEGLYSYQPDGIKGLDLIMTEHIFNFVKERYDIFNKSKARLSFKTVTSSDFDMVKAYDYSYKTVKDTLSQMINACKGMDAFEKYEFHDLDWWIEKVRKKEHETLSVAVDKEAYDKAEPKVKRLVIGFRDLRPYVEIDGKEETGFRRAERLFTRLLLLAAVKIKGVNGGWVDRASSLFDNTQAGQYIYDLNKKFSCKLIKSTGGSARQVTLLMNPDEISIESSVCSFRSRWAEIVETQINQIRKEPDCSPYLLERMSDNGKRAEISFMLVKKALDILEWNWKNEQRTKAIIEEYKQLKEEVSGII